MNWLTATADFPKARYWWAAGACAATVAMALPLREAFDHANIVMLFLLVVLLIALRLGRGPAVLASFLSVALFDFFVPPHLSFAVSDAQYLVTFAVMLAVALITGHLTAGLRQQADLATARERESRTLYEMARDLAGAVTAEQVAEIVQRFLKGSMEVEAVLLLPDAHDRLVATGTTAGLPLQVEEHLATMAWKGPDPIVSNALADLGIATAYYPLKGPMRTRGVLALNAAGDGQDALRERREFFQTVASVVAIALERLHYVEVAEGSRLETASERLRNSVLSALSHDLRTPLTALVGLADTLTYAQPPLPASARETIEGIKDQARGMSSLVTNLLDMARLHAGPVTLRKEWQPLEEVVGAATRLFAPALAGRDVHIGLAPDLPLVEFDAVLIERVLCNLLDNAAKYAPAGTPIEISARREGPVARIAVCDRGPGFPPGRHDELFGMFRRGAPESAKPGVGLGLAICRTIVEAHGGAITAANREGGGGCVAFTLPLGTPPAIDEEPGAAGGEGRP